MKIIIDGQKGLIVIKTDRQKDRLTGLMGKRAIDKSFGYLEDTITKSHRTLQLINLGLKPSFPDPEQILRL
jgi:hypothetical protein